MANRSQRKANHNKSSLDSADGSVPYDHNDILSDDSSVQEMNIDIHMKSIIKNKFVEKQYVDGIVLYVLSFKDCFTEQHVISMHKLIENITSIDVQKILSTLGIEDESFSIYVSEMKKMPTKKLSLLLKQIIKTFSIDEKLKEHLLCY